MSTRNVVGVLSEERFQTVTIIAYKYYVSTFLDAHSDRTTLSVLFKWCIFIFQSSGANGHVHACDCVWFELLIKRETS